MATNNKLTCSICGRSEIPIDGTILLIFPGGRFPVFASACTSCGKVTCLDCSPFQSVPKQYLNFIKNAPPNIQCHGFGCKHCNAPFPSDKFPIRLLVYEGCFDCLNMDPINEFMKPAKLLHFYAYDISHLSGLSPEEQSILREDGIGALITAGLPGVMPIRCSGER